ncbi:MAG: RNA-binding protein [Syntrophomonadaceae bacterium]|nr:RNA-binding protein [Syntrophomonadaceae bacterium]
MVIVGVLNSRFILLADGDLRKIENPKVKNVKHIVYTAMVAEDVVESYKRGEIPSNNSIKNNLKRIQDTQRYKGEGGLVDG